MKIYNFCFINDNSLSVEYPKAEFPFFVKDLRPTKVVGKYKGRTLILYEISYDLTDTLDVLGAFITLEGYTKNNKILPVYKNSITSNIVSYGLGKLLVSADELDYWGGAPPQLYSMVTPEEVEEVLELVIEEDFTGKSNKRVIGELDGKKVVADCKISEIALNEIGLVKFKFKTDIGYTSFYDLISSKEIKALKNYEGFKSFEDQVAEINKEKAIDSIESVNVMYYPAEK